MRVAAVWMRMEDIFTLVDTALPVRFNVPYEL